MSDEDKRRLGIKAVEMFPELFPDTWKHDGPSIDNPSWQCSKCGYVMESCNKPTCLADIACTVLTPIDVEDWNVAMMLVKAAIKIVGYREWIAICEKHTKISRTPLNKATPTDYIKAAIKAKLLEKEGE